MKRTIIAAAACGATLLAAACAPQTPPEQTASTAPDSGRTSTSATAPSRESAPADADPTSSQSPTDVRGDDPAASSETPAARQRSGSECRAGVESTAA